MPIMPSISTHIERFGTLLQPVGPTETEGVLNPAFVRTRDGRAILFPRCVAAGNISRVGLCDIHTNGVAPSATRRGFALEPEASYELRPAPGFGCEDPRVTFLPALDTFVMAYTAYGPDGPRIALALSRDGEQYERLGLVEFLEPGMARGDDKDAAFFPEPVLSPNGVESFAFYHRPMLHISAVDGRAAIPFIERLAMNERESIRIAYVPVSEVRNDINALLRPRESIRVLSPDTQWGSIKVGSGTPPVRIDEGWLSLFHGVDLLGFDGHRPQFRYSAGIVLHDLQRPHEIVYRSPEPVLSPTTAQERTGTVDNVVFPTGIDVRTDLGRRIYDVYYGMADYAVGAARMTLT